MATASSRAAGRGIPPLHLVTDDATLARPDFVPLAEALLRAGGASVALHLRGPHTPGRPLLALAERLAPVARDTGGRLLVNDRVDVAVAARAHGVQLGARGMRPAEARRLLGSRAIVGASVHGVEEARAAQRDGADLLLAGTLFTTPSHPGRPGAGTGWLRELAALGVPVVGIGGITPERVARVRAAGAAGVAVLRGVWEAERPADRFREFLRELEEEPNVQGIIRVQVNGEPREIPAGLTIEGLLEHLSLRPRMVVVEHNGDILRRERYPETDVASGDSLELVHFVGGG